MESYGKGINQGAHLTSHLFKCVPVLLGMKARAMSAMAAKQWNTQVGMRRPYLETYVIYVLYMLFMNGCLGMENKYKTIQYWCLLNRNNGCTQNA